MKTLQLTQGKVALVDDEDYVLVASYKWRAKSHGRTAYAHAHTRGPHAAQKTILMHRLITGAKPGQQVDHVNGDGLDNRRENLRFASQRQNMQNRTYKQAGTTSRFRGVSWREDARKWRATIGAGPIGADGHAKVLYLGYFACEEAAARAYDAAARQHFGAFACVNFPEPPPSEKSA